MNSTQHRWLPALLLSAFTLVLLYSLWSATVGWGTPITQQYMFVQSKAAIASYYIAKGGPILAYEIPVHGPPWGIPYEFPLYQTLTAWMHNLTGIALDSAGRIMAKFFFYLSCVPIFIIARNFGFRGKLVLIPLTLFLASPIYLFWSRQFMIESTATFFGLAYLAAAIAWIKNPNDTKWIAAVLLGIMSALAKSTTYVSFALAVGLYVSFMTFRNRSFTPAILFRAITLLFLPLLTSFLWLRYTDNIKNLNPITAEVHTSAALKNWYLLSSWSNRWKGNLWYHFFRNTIPDAMGHRAAWIFSVLLAFSIGKKAWLYWLCSALFLVAPLLFPQVHLLHDYYANANAIFLILAMAVLIERAINSEKKWLQYLGPILFIIIIAYEVREFMGKGYYQQQQSSMTHVAFAKKLQQVVAPNDVLLLYGEDWSPVIPYHAERRAIMMLNGKWFDPKLADGLKRLQAEGKKIGAIVLCYDARTDRELLSRLSLGPLLLRDKCDAYASNFP